MKKFSVLLTVSLFLTSLSGCSSGELAEQNVPAETTASAENAPSTEKSHGVEAESSERRTMEMNSFNSDLSTAKCTESSNAADFSSLRIEAAAGDQITFEQINFDNAKCLLLETSVSEGSTNKAIELYIDEIKEENKIGTLITGDRAKANDYEFYEQYSELRNGISGTHNLIFSFPEAVELEADWFRLTSYSGAETEEERNVRMKWWRDAKFGQFIHFGAYSYLGGEYSGKKTGWYSEWIMDSLEISKEDYAANVTAHFNPEEFDAKKIVEDAKAAGQKYLVITSRHHEGLSIYDTKIRNFKDYSLTNPESCPEYKGGDILKELSEECKRAGIHFGVYTTIMDWHDICQTSFGEKIAEGHTKEEYKTALKGQLKELIEEYGVEVFFFDGEWVSWWTEADGRELYRYILSLNENCIVNNRVGKRNPSDGDYGTPEQEIPPTGLNYDWESNVTMNNSFGYKKGDNNWKSAQWIVSSVADIVSKGGNMLLNVGPDGSGRVEAPPLENMAAAGEWFGKFGESIYGTEKSCFSKSLGSDVRATVKSAEGKIYVILLETDPDVKGAISIPALENEIIGIIELANGKEVSYEAFENEILLYVSETEKQQFATVYEISVDGAPMERELKPAAENLAKGKSVVTSSNYDGFEGEKMTDGDTTEINENRWAPLDNDTELWAVIDLGSVQTIREVVIREWKDTFFTHDYRVESFKIAVSDDNETMTRVYSGGSIGECLTVDLGENVTGRYIKIYDIERVKGAKGSPSLSEIEVYEKHLPSPWITLENDPNALDDFPSVIGGKYADGNSVTLRVWGAAFAAFEINAETDPETGAWRAVIDRDKLSEGSITLTAILSDENGSQLATTVCTMEYGSAE